jgi:hypothetical protein
MSFTDGMRINSGIDLPAMELLRVDASWSRVRFRCRLFAREDDEEMEDGMERGWSILCNFDGLWGMGSGGFGAGWGWIWSSVEK